MDGTQALKLGVAMALAVLDSDEYKHPKLDCVFTVDEEVGLLGAEALDASQIEARKMINIDSEEEGIITVSCAGGVSAKVIIPVKREKATGVQATICVEVASPNLASIAARANSLVPPTRWPWVTAWRRTS